MEKKHLFSSTGVPMAPPLSRPLLLLWSSPLLLLVLFGRPAAAASDPFWHSCNDTGNYTTNSSFAANLALLLTSLLSDAPATGFSNITRGNSPPNQVYGRAVCRGDVDPAACRACLGDAVRDVPRLCPGKKNATVWYDRCTLRYSERRFFSLFDGFEYWWDGAEVPEPALFNRSLAALMRGLARRAAYDGSPSSRMFAVGEANYTSFSTIYGLAQCSEDLSPGECDRCLTEEINDIPLCCNGITGVRFMGSCFMRYELYRFYNAYAAESPWTADTAAKKNHASKIIIIVIILVVTAVVLLLAMIIRMRRRRPIRRALNERDGHTVGSVESILFDFRALRIATDNFSEANKLGSGGFGTVYKGALPDGRQIAVKKLSKNSNQGLTELRNEVAFVARLQHRNLVTLLGSCLEEQEKMLVYEYVPNASLDMFLFDPIKCLQLDWGRRYKLIEGIARGLVYLHEDSRLRVIHRDLKASNILLDEDMNPKISDFGLAKHFGVDQPYGNTNRIAGTRGYMAPEYVMYGHFSTKSDVFSFGVLILEILTGRRSSSFCGSGNAANLLSYVWHNWKEGTTLELLDQTVGERCQQQNVLRCIHIGLLCVQEDPSERPNMSSVALMLSSPSLTLPAPSEPAFVIGKSNSIVLVSDGDSSLLENQNSSQNLLPQSRLQSANEVTISDLEPR